MGIYTEAIQKLYVAYFNRPADAGGLQYWEGVVAAAKGDTSAVSKAFAASDEYKAAYAGKDAYNVVATVYQNLFGHAPDVAGLNFWAQGLMKGDFKIDFAVTEIAKGALGTDATAYASKVAAATAFTAALDTTAEILAYSGDAANAIGKAFIASVTGDASLKAAIDTAALNATINSVINNGPGSQGKVFSLTAGLDTIVGTAGNDTINVYAINTTTGADATNLKSYDSIDGGAGNDTLNIEIVAGRNADFGTITNVETINITADAATAIDASLFAGATAINQIGKAGTISKLAVGTTAGFQAITTDLTVAAAGASAAVALTNVAETAALNVSGSKLASVTVSGTRADSNADKSLATMNLNMTVGKDVQTVTVNTNQATNLVLTEDVASAKHVTTIDASASTGAFTYDETVAGAVLAANVSTGSGKDTVKVNVVTAAATSTAAAVNSTISTGAGNDTITVANTGTGLTTIDGGAGDDTITVTKTNGAGLAVTGGEGNDSVALILAAGSAMEVSDVIDGGAGTDIISLAGSATARTADDFIVFNKMLKNFETIKFSTTEGSGTVSFDASKLAATYTTIDLAAGSYVKGVGSQALVANGALTATAAGYVAATVDADAVYAGSLNITEKATGTVTANADALTLAVKAKSTAAVAATVAGDLQSATIALTNSVDSTGAIDRLATVTVDNTATLSGLKSLTLTGNGSATVTNAGGVLTSVDASALGGTLADGSVTTGLTYSSTSGKVETIKLGSGIDSVTIANSTYGKVDTITGLNLVAKSDLSGLKATSDVLHVTGVATTVKVFTTTQTDLDLALKEAAVSSKGNDLVFVMGGDTYIYHDGGTADVVDAADILVKLTGTVDLQALILSLGGTPV